MSYSNCISKLLNSQGVSVDFDNISENNKAIIIPEFKNCIKTFTKWRYYIAESFSVPYTNAYTEGKHNFIKTLKRIARNSLRISLSGVNLSS